MRVLVASGRPNPKGGKESSGHAAALAKCMRILERRRRENINATKAVAWSVRLVRLITRAAQLAMVSVRAQRLGAFEQVVEIDACRCL